MKDRSLVEFGIEAFGRKEYLKFIDNGDLTVTEVLRCNCYYCQVGFHDGRVDCENDDCPIYKFMIYGKAWKNRKKKELSPKQQENLKKLLAANKNKKQHKIASKY